MAGFMELQVWRGKGGWYSRYSAPGYLDCTDTEGPYNTKEAAAIECFLVYGEEGDSEDLTPDEQELLDIVGPVAFSERYN